MSTSAVNPTGVPATSSATASSASSATSNSTLASEAVFMQLLVAQLKNQDPQNPADGTQFVTQLAQFASLEQQTQGTSDLGSILGILQQNPTAVDSSTPSSSGTGSNGGSSNSASPATNS